MITTKTTLLTSSLLLAFSLVTTPAYATEQSGSAYLHEYSVRQADSAPFANINWLEDNRLTAEYNGKWYYIDSINGHTVEKLLNELVVNKKQKVRASHNYITERLLDVFDYLDINIPNNKYVLIDGSAMSGDEVLNQEKVLLTPDNFKKVRIVRRAKQNNSAKGEDGKPVKKLTVAEAHADIDQYHQDLIHRFAYLKANGVDHQQVIKQTKAKVTKPITASELKNLLNLITAQFIDGHAGPGHDFNDAEVSPFVVKRIGERFVAINTDGEQLVDANFPYITHIDDKPVSFWRELVTPFIADGSYQMVSRRALRQVVRIGALRQMAGLENKDSVTVTLINEKGDKYVKHTLATLSPEQNPKLRMPKKQYKSRMLDGNIGYLRIAQMNDPAVTEIRTWMPQFENTDGLIVDVRSNGGGSRKAYLELMPYFMQAGQSHIGNISAYRLYDDFKKDHLSGARFSYLATDPRLNKQEKQAIQQFQQTFTPEWQFDKSEFSDYHYFMASKREGDHRYDYRKPVVVLTDDGCFSATDIFVGAMKGFGNITVMGTDTGGGSARTVSETLDNSGLSIRLASMVSFQPSGLLYDGRGIMVDKQVLATPESLLKDGEDNQLNAAIAHINKANK